MAQFYERYWNNDSGHLPDFHIKWPKLRQFIPNQKNITILDFGCGQGAILEELKKINPDARYIGLDVSGTALEKAKKRLPGVEFHLIVDGEKLPLGDRIVDFIFSSEVIEHIYDTENAFSEMTRILKPGGQVLLTTPYHGFLKNLAITLTGFDKHFDPFGPHIRFFSKKTLLDGLRGRGLDILKVGYYGRFYPLSHSIFVLAKKTN